MIRAMLGAACLALTVGGCAQPEAVALEDQPAGNSADASAASSDSDAQTPASKESAAQQVSASSNKAVLIEGETEDFTFTYGWPADASREGKLKAYLEQDAKKARKEVAAEAQETRKEAQENDFPFRAHSLEVIWKTVTDLPRFLSLSANVYTYAGGAHPNSGFDALIWDREAERKLGPNELFESEAALEEAVSEPFCTKLNAQREKRRGLPIDAASEDIFDQCPKLAELTVLLGSSNGKTFNRIGMQAAPYVAGAYAEGPYEITLPVTENVMQAVKSEYREYFTPSG